MRLTVCICTRNRPADLTTALQSVRASSVRVEQIVVSDDSTDDRTKELIVANFGDVDFVEGPRRGLCANRNAALRAVSGTHVLFIDDDAALGKHFVEQFRALLLQLAPAEHARTIVSGLERLRGELIHPSDQSFFGYQNKPYQSGDTIKTVVINAAVFPTSLFEQIGFDTNLMYGSDEVDLTTRAVALGYKITMCPAAINDHYSSNLNRDAYRKHLNASRLYVTLKRYCFTERDYRKAAIFCFAAPLHLTISNVKRSGIAGVTLSSASVAAAVSYLVRYIKKRSDLPPRVPRSVASCARIEDRVQ